MPGRRLALGSAKQRAVLALLILHAPEPVSTERLVDECWGECPPTTAQHAVQVYVSGIRKLLHAASGGVHDVVVRTSPSGYMLGVGPGSTLGGSNVSSSTRSVRWSTSPRAREGCVSRLSRCGVVCRWVKFELFGAAKQEADRLAELRTLAAEGLVEARLACGEHAELIGDIKLGRG
jgi:hypothetical protein